MDTNAAGRAWCNVYTVMSRLRAQPSVDGSTTLAAHWPLLLQCAVFVEDLLLLDARSVPVVASDSDCVATPTTYERRSARSTPVATAVSPPQDLLARMPSSKGTPIR
jgi:hypothetical protein